MPVRNPHAVRPWQHVTEPLGAYLALAGRMLQSNDSAWCEAWNFGPLPGNDVTVGQLVDQFIAAWGSGTWQDVSDPNQPPETGILRLAIDKAHTKLGWQPRWGLDEAVRRTAEWYRRAYASEQPDMRAACLDDIAAHEASE